MSEYLINSSTLTGIADAIRSKTGSSSAFTPSQMISEIENIPKKKTAIMPRTYRASSFTSYTGDEDYILDDAFFFNRNLADVSFSNCIVIENNAFESCPALSTVYFPNCQYIGWSAFKSCFSRSTTPATISFPNCTYIDGGAFHSCRYLIAVSFPNCSYISQGAFNTCAKLETAYFPKCTTIGDAAFRNCSVLSSLYLNEVESVPKLFNYVFDSTPLSAGGTGKIYVPSSLYNAFITASNWSDISARLVSM